jgi:hypothetical protein
MGGMTYIYASSNDEIPVLSYDDYVWYPEVGMRGNRPVPVHPRKQLEDAHKLVGRTVMTNSEYIILWFLREIGEGRLDPSGVVLSCDGQLIRIDSDGELIDRWPGGFYRERAALLFY